jgi:hydroxymethylglutaryl-CoA reductase
MKPTDAAAPAAAPSARLSGFRTGNPAERRRRLVEEGWLSADDAALLADGVPLDEGDADAMIENVIGVHALPLSVATNFKLDGREVLVPMCVEEPSIVAATSYAARMVLAGGGFTSERDEPLLAAQVQLLQVADPAAAAAAIQAAEREVLANADRVIPTMKARGGGARRLEVRDLGGGMVVVHVLVDCRDAMGANLVNTVAEEVAPLLARLAGGARVGLRILTNLSDCRKVTLRARVPLDVLPSEGHPDGAAVRDGIIDAQRFAEADPYRAATHNKGVMNGVDAVLLACGNDWRAVEAGAHAYAARNGRYEPLTRWSAADDGALLGEVTLPLAASTVGGAARNHAGVALALRILKAEKATDLAAVAAAAGLAANLAALRALATDGIQRGHMALHARRIAAEAGARGELVELVARRLTAEKSYRPERARAILDGLTRQPAVG